VRIENAFGCMHCQRAQNLKMEVEVAEQKNNGELIEVRPDKDQGSIRRRLADQASITKIATQIAFLEQEMRLRKRKFGVQIGMLCQSHSGFSYPPLIPVICNMSLKSRHVSTSPRAIID
jgi:hypothetical protein